MKKEVPKMPFWLLLLFIIFAVVVISFQIIHDPLYPRSGDYYSYHGAWQRIYGLHTDMWRPPVYVIIVGVCLSICGDLYGPVLATMLNWGFWLCSIWYMWRIMYKLSIPLWLRYTLSALFFLTPFWVTNQIAIPEVFCMFLLSVMVFWVISFLDSPTKIYVYKITAVTIILIFTKPVFIFLLPVLALFWAVNWKHGGLIGECGVAIAGIAIICYMLVMAHAYECRPFLTRATMMNDYYILRQEGEIKPEDITNQNAREIFEQFYQSDPGHVPYTYEEGIKYYDEAREFSMREFQELTLDAKKAHRDVYNKATINRFKESILCSNECLSYDDIQIICPLKGKWYFPIGLSWLIILITTVMMLKDWKRNRTLSKKEYILASVTFSMYFLAVYGAQNDWGRLTVPVIPEMIISFGLIATRFGSFIRRVFNNLF